MPDYKSFYGVVVDRENENHMHHILGFFLNREDVDKYLETRGLEEGIDGGDPCNEDICVLEFKGNILQV